MHGLSKKKFCRSAKSRSLKRPRVVRSFRKASVRAHKLRSKHLNEYCRDVQTKTDKKFCKTAKKLSVKRLRYDNRVTKTMLRRASKRRSALLKHCK